MIQKAATTSKSRNMDSRGMAYNPKHNIKVNGDKVNGKQLIDLT